jgi:hypothetical protein
MGFYPTPPEIVDLVRTWLRFPAAPFPALDPCAGEGEALARCVHGSKAVTYGIELDGGRVLAARQRLHRVLCCDALQARTAHDAWSLLWLNPPYDSDTAGEGSRAERKELQFLAKYTPRLLPQGVLVYILPQAKITAEVAGYLARHYDRLVCRRFPGALYWRFRQAVVLGAQKVRPWEDPAAAATLLAVARQGEAAPALEPRPETERPYTVPEADPEVSEFASAHPAPEVAEAEVRSSPLWRTLEILSGAIGVRQAGRPPVPVHKGHLALLLASGEIDGPVGTGPERHVVRGVAVKYTQRETRPVETTDRWGRPEIRDRVFEVEQFRVQVTCLLPDGTLYTL